jgi:hypothetical protein
LNNIEGTSSGGKGQSIDFFVTMKYLCHISQGSFMPFRQKKRIGNVNEPLLTNCVNAILQFCNFAIFFAKKSENKFSEEVSRLFRHRWFMLVQAERDRKENIRGLFTKLFFFATY